MLRQGLCAAILVLPVVTGDEDAGVERGRRMVLAKVEWI
jgi:hypothetical protein